MANGSTQKAKSKWQKAKSSTQKAISSMQYDKVKLNFTFHKSHFAFSSLPFAFCRLQFTFCFLTLAFCLLFNACNINRFLKNDEYVVRSNKFVLKGDISRKESANIKKTLLPPLSRQKELPVFLGLTKSKVGAWNYFKSISVENKKGVLPSIYRTFSSKPNIFDERLTQISADNMKQALINAGYRDNKVTFDKLFIGKNKGLADVTYNVDLGTLYVFDTVSYICADSVYGSILKKAQENSLLQPGTAVSSSNYEKEKARLVDYFNSKGYARFAPNFIVPLDADTTTVKFNEKNQRLIEATLTVVLPDDSTQLRKFYIGDVSVFPNYDINKGETIKFDTVVGTNIIRTYDGIIGLKASLLNDLITFKSGEIFNKTAITKTYKKITGIGVYKFVNIASKIDECDSNAVSLNIYLTPNKKMAFEVGANLNASILRDSIENLYRAGGSVNAGFTHLNLFNSAIRFSSTITAGVDFGINKPRQSSNGKSYDLNFDNRFNFPKILNLNATWGLLSGLNLVSKIFKEGYKENATTELNATFGTSNRLELDLFRLDRYNVGLRDIYKRETNINERFIISPSALEFNLGKITDSFRTRNINQTRIIRSFDTTLVTGLFFRSFNYDFTTPPNAQNQVFQFAFGFQQSGGELFLFDKILRADKEPSQLNGINFAKFIRFDLEFRYNKEIIPKINFALKAGLGLATPYGDAIAVPFTYQYLLGGTNSIRAWRLGSIGPGGFYDPNTANSSFPAQAGEFKFEINSELRFPIYSYFKGAIFLDAGNVWNLSKDEAEPKAELSKYWYSQMAIGTGLGLRIDVDYFLIRIDVGFKLRYPYPKYPDSSYWIPIKLWNLGDQLNFNFGIGLPF